MANHISSNGIFESHQGGPSYGWLLQKPGRMSYGSAMLMLCCVRMIFHLLKPHTRIVFGGGDFQGSADP